jgi:acetyl-CoA carboxylase carboxyltransferase component
VGERRVERTRGAGGPGSPKTVREATAEIAELKSQIKDDARPRATAYQHGRGRLTARERVEALVDNGTFVELGQLGRPAAISHLMAEVDAPADGIIIGRAQVEGRPVVVVAYDFTVLGGSMGLVNDQKFGRARQIALSSGLPLIMLVEGAGARINERMGSSTIRGHERFSDLSLLSGWVPVVTGVLGPTFAGHGNLVALSDFTAMIDGASVGMAGPRLVEMATGEVVTPEELGGASLHAKKLGSIELQVPDEVSAISAIKRYLSYFPSNSAVEPPAWEPPERKSERLPDLVMDLVPYAANQPYDMRNLVRLVLDENSDMELKPTFARNIITCLGRLGGIPVGLIANNPMFLAGAIDAAASHKMARFINICDAFRLPLIFLTDTPGYLIGTSSEAANILRASMRPLWELGQSTVPILTVIVRKAFGLAYHTMGGAEFHPDLLACWPCAQISPMGAEGAVSVLLGHRTGTNSVEREELVAEFKRLERPLSAASAMKIDDIIDPRDTRETLLKTLRSINPTHHSSGHWRPPKKRGISPF